MIKRLFVALALLAPAPAKAVTCVLGGGPLNLCIPAAGDTSSWASNIITDMRVISTNTLPLAGYSTARPGFGSLVLTSTTSTSAFPILDVQNHSGTSLLKMTDGGTLTLPAGSIDTAKLAADAVTTVKILDANVTTAKIAQGAIDTAKIAATANITVTTGTYTSQDANGFSIKTSSGIDLSGGQIKFESGSAGILWADGTRSTTSASGSSGSLFVSSVSVITQSTALTSQTTLVVACSTVALTVTNGEAWVSFAGSIRVTGSNAEVVVAVLVDGQFVSGYVNNRGITSQQITAGTSANLSFPPFQITGLSNATHNFALVFSNTAGSMTVDANTSSARAQFTAMKWK